MSGRFFSEGLLPLNGFLSKVRLLAGFADGGRGIVDIELFVAVTRMAIHRGLDDVESISDFFFDVSSCDGLEDF